MVMLSSADYVEFLATESKSAPSSSRRNERKRSRRIQKLIQKAASCGVLESLEEKLKGNNKISFFSKFGPSDDYFSEFVGFRKIL